MAFIDSGALAALTPASLDDAALMLAQRSLAAARHELSAAEARVAAEISRRSSRDLGYGGLAARQGLRSDVELVQSLTGSSRVEARKLVSVGNLVTSAAAGQPWLQPALGLPVAALDAIRGGLGVPSTAVSSDDLAEAARQLVAEAPQLDVDALARRARELRSELDLASVGLREEELRAQRYLRLSPLPSGMTRVTGLLDPESAAIVVGAVDAITSPRRGGPRFVDAREPAGATDERTIDQLMCDALVDIVSVAVRAPSGTLFGKSRPGVRVLVTLDDLNSGEGAAFIEGQSEPVSVETARRHVCAAGLVPIGFDRNGRGMDLGRDERLHDGRQRKVIAVRDGGCIAPGCPCPPAWTEVHHIVPWSEGGSTSVDDGVLLCRFHHLMVHNLGWRVVRRGAEYLFIPPASKDPDRVPIPLVSKSPALRRLLRGAARSGAARSGAARSA